MWVILAMTALATTAVHFNTIVHPFTLADNRHYVFYVFRILLRHPAIKYLAVPVYVLCGWACIRALGTPPNLTDLVINGQTTTISTSPARVVRETGSEKTGCDVSFVIIWLATSALSLVTAPLVEPRYFILPWLIWRLHIPTAVEKTRFTPPPGNLAKEESSKSQEEQPGWSTVIRLLRALQENAVWLELAWFLVINTVTGYVFLYKGFEWPQEPGQVQRFMW